MMENPYAGQGAVLLDVGGTVGALVVFMPPDLAGTEAEIARRATVDDPDRTANHDHDRHHHRPHVGVVARPVAGGVVHSLVFAELIEGDYELCQRPNGPVELVVTVVGGRVTEASWPGSGGG